MNHRKTTRYVLKILLMIVFFFFNNIKNLPNVFLRRISEITIMMDVQGGRGTHQIQTMTDKGGAGGKKSNILPEVLCERPVISETKVRFTSLHDR